MQKIIKLVLAFIIFLLSGKLTCSQEVNKNNIDMETTNKQVIRNLYEVILNQKKLDLLNAVIDDNYSGVRGEKGAEGFRQTIGPLIAAFPDIQWKIEDLFAEGNKVIVRWKWTGTFKNAFRDFQPNQKQFTSEAIVIYEMANKKAMKAWMQSDQLGFLVQAGVVSPAVLAGGAGKKTN